MLKHVAATSLALLLCLSEKGVAQTVEAGALRVGDRWSYDIRDGATGDLRHAVTVVVVEISDKEITTRVSMKGKDRPNTVVYDLNWGAIDNGVWQYRPSEIGIRSPLQIGKEWRSDASGKNLQTGVALRTSGVAKVVGQEQVTTAAGTFDTYRIETKTRQTQTRDQTKSATVTQVSWYAPAVNRWVRRTQEMRFDGRLRDSFTEELTEHSRKP